MLGFFTGKNKDKHISKVEGNNHRKSNKKGESKSDDNTKEQKLSRFSFKRSRSSESRKSSKIPEKRKDSCPSSTELLKSFDSSTPNANTVVDGQLENIIIGNKNSVISINEENKFNFNRELPNNITTNESKLRMSPIKKHRKNEYVYNTNSNKFTNSRPNASPTFLHGEGRNYLNLVSPSSSTSSLSSISSIPLSTSGRATPPGPRLGTCSRTGASPIPSRNNHRTSIKTNPSFSSKKLNLTVLEDIKLNNTKSYANYDKNGLPPLSPTFEPKNVNRGNFRTSMVINNSPKIRKTTNSPSNTNQSLNSNKIRNSASSLHSLESIPESENNSGKFYICPRVKKHMIKNTEVINRLTTSKIGTKISNDAESSKYKNSENKYVKGVSGYVAKHNKHKFPEKQNNNCELPKNIEKIQEIPNNIKSLEYSSNSDFCNYSKIKNSPMDDPNKTQPFQKQFPTNGRGKCLDLKFSTSSLVNDSKGENSSLRRRNSDTIQNKFRLQSKSIRKSSSADSMNKRISSHISASTDNHTFLLDLNIPNEINHGMQIGKGTLNRMHHRLQNGYLSERRSLSPSVSRHQLKIKRSTEYNRSKSVSKEHLLPSNNSICTCCLQKPENFPSRKTTNDSIRQIKSKSDENFSDGKEVESQTNRYQQQIDQLTVKLTQEQQLVFQLRQDLSDSQTSTGNLKQDLEESKKKNSVTTSLEIKIQELSRQIREKEAATESVRVDLQYEKNELDKCKSKIRRLEDDLSQSAKTIQKLEKQLTSRSQDSSKAGDFEAKIKMLEDKLLQSESTRRNLEASMEEIEEEREDEMKIVQDALDEAAQEREELIKTFQKELDNANSMNTDREQQMLDDFEWKLREMQKENKKTLDDMENQAENTLHKRKYSEDDEYRIKLEKVKKEINSEWEDKLRQESARLKVCLESKYDQEQETALDDLRNQYENEHKNFNKSYEIKEKEMSEEMLNLRKLLSEKESNHQKEVEDLRTNSDRDIWELRMKLQKMNDSSYDKEQKLIEKHFEELERLRIDYDERIKEMNTRIEDYELRIGVDTIDKLNKDHRKQIEHLGEQHRLSMERLREESEGDKFQSVEEARLALTNNYEQLSVSLREKLTEADIQISQYKMELQNALDLANKRKDTIQNYEEQIEQLKQIQSLGASIPMTSSSSGIISQYSLETQSFNGSQDSQNSQDTGSCSDSGHEDNHKNGGGSLLGKVFGGGWFQPHKSRRGSTSLTNKKTY